MNMKFLFVDQELYIQFKIEKKTVVKELAHNLGKEYIETKSKNGVNRKPSIKIGTGFASDINKFYKPSKINNDSSEIEIETSPKILKYTDSLVKSFERCGLSCVFFESNKKMLIKKKEPEIISYNKFEDELSQQVEKSKRSSSYERRLRLAKAKKLPKQVKVTVIQYKRNPDVIAEILFQAKGVCQDCKVDAPFRKKKDGSPYLEVHHRTPLSEKGEDTLGNAIALCPNCHRKRHYG